MRAWLAVAALASFVAPAGTLGAVPESGAISGRVIDRGLEGHGVRGATVGVEGEQLSVQTDDAGRFTLEGVPPGPVVLVVEAPAYVPTRWAVSAEARDRPVVVSIQWSGEELTITAVPSRSQPDTASTTLVTPRAMTAAPVRNAEEILRQVPGLTLVQHGSEGKGHQFFLRGFDAIHGADLELTLDAIPLNEWSNVHAQGYLDLGIIIPELVQSVAVTKGPFTLEQGAFAMAGSAGYRLGVPVDDLGWRAAYTAGTTNRHRLFAGFAPDGGGGLSFFGVEATHDEGFGDNRGLDRATFNGRVRLLELGEGGSLELLALGGYASFELPGSVRNDDVEEGLVDFYGTYDPLAEGTSARGLLGLTFDWAGYRDELSITAYGGYRRLGLLENFTGLFLDPEDGDRRDQSQETWSFGLVGTHAWRWSEALTLRSGLGVRGDVFRQRETNVGRALEVLEARRDLDGLQIIVHGLAGLSWSPVENVRVDGGARVDVVQIGVTDRLEGDARGEGTLVAASPRLTARWRPVDAWRLYVAYGRGFRPPEARAFSSFEPGAAGIGDEVLVGAEPRLTVSDAVEVGTRWSPVPWWNVQLSGFATFIERESIFDHVSGVSLELNGTRRLGGELVLSSEPVRWLSLEADLTLVDARFVESGNQVPLAPWLVSGLRSVVTHESGLRGGLRVLTVAPRPLPHGATGSTLVMTDATFGYHWGAFRLDLEVENLLNQRLREGEYHYASHWRPGEQASELPALHTIAGPPLNARLTLGVWL